MWLARIEPDAPGHDKRVFECPQCSQNRTSEGHRRMLKPFTRGLFVFSRAPMSAFWPLADIPSCTAHVCFWAQS
jgi:hypothetical protein